MANQEIDESRVLVLALSRRELEFTSALLKRGEIASYPCLSFADVIAAIDAGAGCVVMTDDVLAQTPAQSLVQPLAPSTVGALLDRLSKQPAWSELPFIVLARTAASADTAVATLGAVTLTTILERPVRVRTLASTVGAALRARRRQYDMRRHAEQLQAAGTDLEHANRTKDEFLAVLAHELRNPLAPIRTAVHFLSARQSADPAQRSAYEMIQRQLTHLVRLVDDLLDVSRVALGHIQVKREVIALQDVLRDAIEAARPLVEASRHLLLVRSPETPIYLDGDTTRLTQVFQNLLNNAAKYTPAGGRISLVASADCGIVTVRTTDNGVGIRADRLERVFQPFVQGPRSANRAKGGIGVGLALASKLVALHDGTLEAHSEGEGRGSEFIVKLPQSFSTPKGMTMHTSDEPSSSSQPASHGLGGLRRVLVVDDNVDAAESLSLLLEFEGADVKQAHNGYDALSILQEFRADVVVLDIGMPGLDGYAVCRRLRELPHGKDLRIFALTGWGQQEDRRRSHEAGFDAHLVKPVDPMQLTQILSDPSLSRTAELAP